MASFPSTLEDVKLPSHLYSAGGWGGVWAGGKQVGQIPSGQWLQIDTSVVNFCVLVLNDYKY